MDISAWMREFSAALQKEFPGRIRFAGLQGSFARGEADERSDIDAVTILDELSPADIRRYRAMLDTLPHRERICGFLSGRAELLNWEPSELLQFYYDTVPAIGSLDALLPRIDDAAAERAVWSGVCSVYHGCVHNLVHERDPEILKSLFKSAVFAVQAIQFRQTGTFIRKHSELLEKTGGKEKEIVAAHLALKSGQEADFDALSDLLFRWPQEWIARLAAERETDG